MAERPGRMLVIDDKGTIRHLVEVNMARNGWDVDLAATGTRAKELLLEHRYTLILMDQTMPDKPVLHGYEPWRNSDGPLPPAVLGYFEMYRPWRDT